MSSPPAPSPPALQPADAEQPSATAGRPGEITSVLRAAIAPVLSAALLVGLLLAWTESGGAGTLRRVHVDITLAAIPISLRPGAGRGLAAAPTYLDIKNLGAADELLGATSPAAARVLLVRLGRSPFGRGGRLGRIPLAAGGTLDLSPFGTDVVLLRPRALHTGEIVPITLVFRQAGRVRVDLTVTSALSP